MIRKLVEKYFYIIPSVFALLLFAFASGDNPDVFNSCVTIMTFLSVMEIRCRKEGGEQ